MEEEKIFKDLTKKYADLAKKIHSKDKRSVSLIKDCYKRIALLDKLRVLEVSYLKCLKNKVKKGHKGGAHEYKVADDNEEDEGDANKQQAAGIIDKALDEADTTNNEGEDNGAQLNNNHQRALDVCTTALKNSMDLKDEVKNYIENKIDKIAYTYNNINEDEDKVKEKLTDAKNKLIKLKDDLINNKGINTREDVIEYFNGVKDILAEKVSDLYNDKKDITLGEIVDNLSQRGNKVVKALSPVIMRGVGVAKQGYETTRQGVEVVRQGLGVASSYGKTLLQSLSTSQKTQSGSGKKTTYRLNGEKVVLLHKNKKVQRSIYVKGNGKTKYCKIDHQYILLSKLKNKIQ
jgi:hypothetical protein